MENQQNLELIKEKLREKDREMRHRETLQSKSEERVKLILSLSDKKIEGLRETITKQEKKIQYTQLVATQKIREIKEVTVQDPKLLDELENLKKKNKALLDKTETEEKERKRLEKEKNLLVKEFKKQKSLNLDAVQQIQKDLKKVEKLSSHSQIKVEEILKEKERLGKEKSSLLEKIKKLQGDPVSVKNLQKKIAAQEKKIKESLRKSEGLAREKARLIESYEQMLFIDGNEGKDGKRRLPSEIIEELKEELATLKEEKKKFEKKLKKEKKAFEEKLKKEKEKIKEELKKRANVIRKAKFQTGAFGQEVMDDDGSPGWVVTYADMVTLLMVFFVLFFSITKENMSIMEAAIEGEGAAGVGLLELMDSLEIREKIRVQSREVPDIDKVENVSSDRTKIVFRVPGNSLFEPGSAYLKKEARKVLEEIVKVTHQYPKYKINIQGHTDDTPISSERFPTNWELSASRATAVLRFFIDKGVEPKRLTATGYSDIFPLVPNVTELGRSKNRRVEFVLEKESKF